MIMYDFVYTLIILGSTSYACAISDQRHFFPVGLCCASNVDLSAEQVRACITMYWIIRVNLLNFYLGLFDMIKRLLMHTCISDRLPVRWHDSRHKHGKQTTVDSTYETGRWRRRRRNVSWQHSAQLRHQVVQSVGRRLDNGCGVADSD